MTLFHFVYESILAPSIRLQLRFDLFRLRDQLRALKIDRASLHDKHFDYLHDSINTLVANLPRFDAATLARLHTELEQNSALRKKSEERSKVMDDCDLLEAREIRRKCNHIGVVALIVNSAGWSIYVLPIVLLVAGLSEVNRRIKAVLSIPEGDFAKVVPCDLATAAS